MRVALLANILSPYRVPVFRALAGTPGWTLRVMLSADTEFDRSWRVEQGDLDVEVVRGLSLARRTRTRGRAAATQWVTLHLPFGLLRSLRRFEPDVVVSGQLGARTLLALLYCKLFRVPFVIWSYHSRVSATSAGPLQRAMRRALLASADAVVGMGAQAREVLGGLGVPSERLFDAPNAHDRDGLLRAMSERGGAGRAEALRGRLGCRERVALVVGRLVPVKGIRALLRAWERMPESVRASWTLLFVGDGPLGKTVANARADHPPGEIAQAGWVDSAELVDYYQAARLLVFASLGDTWGLVVNEAMTCGLPVLCSTHAACADDMVRHAENGWVFDPADDDAFAEGLANALTCPDLDRPGARARASAKRFHPEAMAEGIRRSVVHAVASRTAVRTLAGAHAGEREPS